MRFDVDSIVRPIRNTVSNGVKTSHVSRPQKTTSPRRRLRFVASWRAAVILLMVFAAIWYYSGRALSRDYSWTQTSWDATADADLVTGLAKHNPTPPGFPQSGWTKYFSLNSTALVNNAGDGTKDIQLALSGQTSIADDTESEFTSRKATTSNNVQVNSAGSVTLQGTGQWATRAFLPSGVNTDVGAALAYDGTDIIYAFIGNNEQKFYKYSIADDTWTQLTNALGNVGGGAALAYVPGSTLYVYATQGGGSQKLWRYNVSTNSWAELAPAPHAIGVDGDMVYDGSQYLYVMKGGASGNRFFRYDINDGQWDNDPPNDFTFGSTGPGGSLAYANSKIYAARGESTATLGVYNTNDGATGIVSSLTSQPTFAAGGSMAFSTAQSRVFALPGGSTPGFLSFLVDSSGVVVSDQDSTEPGVQSAWRSQQNFPALVDKGGALVYAPNKNMFFAFGGGDNKYYYYYAYPSSGSYISNVIDLISIKKLDRVNFTVQQPTGTTATVSARAGDTSSLSGSWTVVANGADISGLNGAGGGRRYIQYKVDFTTTNPESTPTLEQIQFTYSSYATNGELVSSPYDASNSETFIAGIKWTEDATLPVGTNVQFQIRTAPTQTDLASVSTLWQGPIWRTTAVDPQSYYENISQPTICPKASGVVTCTIPGGVQINAKNQFFQYRILLTSSGANTPIVKDVSVTYVINTPPAVQITNTPQKDSSALVRVEYTVSDAEETSAFSYLFYDIGVELEDPVGVVDTSLVLKNFNFNYIPTSGIIMIDNEWIVYTGKSGNQLTGLIRGNMGYLRSTKADHIANTVVWIRAVNVSDENAPQAYGPISMSSSPQTKTMIWSPNSDVPNLFYATAKVRVAVNDNQIANQIGSSAASIASGGLDTQPPQAGAEPIIINNRDAKTSNPNVTLVLDASGEAPGSLYMALSNDNFFNTETCVPFQSTATWTLPGPDIIKNIYVWFCDSQGNRVGPYSDSIVLDRAPPATPSGLSASEGSNESTGDVIMVLTWTLLDPPPADAAGPDFRHYNLYRSPPPTGVTPDADGFGLFAARITDLSTNVYADRICGNETERACIGQTFSYKISAEDNINNVSSLSSPISAPPLTGRALDPLPPLISKGSISAGTSGTLYLPISWIASESPSSDRSDSRVAYVAGSISDDQWSAAFASAQTTINTTLIAGGAEHKVFLVGLEPGQTYSFETRSQDLVGNPGAATGTQTTLTFPDVDRTPPTISIVPPTPYNTSATVRWSTNNEPATSFVEYNGALYGNFGYSTDHMVTLPMTLTAGNSYACTIHSRDVAGNDATASCAFSTIAGTGTNFSIDAATLSAAPVERSATISWTTDRAASSYVEWGTSVDADGKPTYTRIEGSRELVSDAGGGIFQHSVVLPQELLPQTTYYYRARSVDGFGKEAISEKAMFFTQSESSPDTQAPTISNVTIRGVGKTSAVVEWTTSEAANSTVGYSKGAKTYNLSRTVPGFRISHSVEIPGLDAGALYYIRVASADPSGKPASKDKDDNGEDYIIGTISPIFSGGNAVGVTISNVVVTSSDSGTSISFTTSEPAYGLVEYGFTTNYREAYGQSALATTHNIALPADILGNVTYSFQVRARTPDGREGVSRDISVFTAPPSAATIIADDPDPPIISQVTIPVVTETTAVITWVTNKPASASIVYGQTTLYGNNASSSAYNFTHSLNLTGLSEATTYYFRISAVGQNDKEAREDQASPPTACQSYGTGCLSFTTKKSVTPGRVIVLGERADKDAPRVRDVVVQASSTTAVISWNTDEDANHFVEYGKKSGALTSLSGDADEFVREHKVNLENLTASTTYYFHAISYDTSGNKGISDDQSFTTKAIDAEELARQELEKKLKENADKQRLQLLEKLSLLASSTQSIVTNFLDQLKLLSAEEQDKILEILFGEVIGPVRILRELPEVQVTDSTVIISWDTLKETNSLVAYATDNMYKPDADDPYGTIAGNEDAFGTQHQVMLTGLEPSTLYHYQLRAAEKTGKKFVSIDRTFKTHALKPEFEMARISARQERSATIQWATTLPTDGVVELMNIKTKERVSQGDPNFKKRHELVLTNLNPAMQYQAIITASTEEGVVVRSKALVFTTGIDTRTPAVSSIRTRLALSPAEKNTAQAVITWETDEPATTLVRYAEGAGSGPLAQTIEQKDDLTMSHVVLISKLRPNTIYRFRAISRDESGNEGSSKEFKFITPQEEESVLELIIKNFEEIFGFIRGGKK